jgi:hypothetical protein
MVRERKEAKEEKRKEKREQEGERPWSIKEGRYEINLEERRGEVGDKI